MSRKSAYGSKRNLEELWPRRAEVLGLLRRGFPDVDDYVRESSMHLAIQEIVEKGHRITGNPSRFLYERSKWRLHDQLRETGQEEPPPSPIKEKGKRCAHEWRPVRRMAYYRCAKCRRPGHKAVSGRITACQIDIVPASLFGSGNVHVSAPGAGSDVHTKIRPGWEDGFWRDLEEEDFYVDPKRGDKERAVYELLEKELSDGTFISDAAIARRTGCSRKHVSVVHRRLDKDIATALALTTNESEQTDDERRLVDEYYDAIARTELGIRRKE